MSNQITYSDEYFRYFYLLMRYGAGIKRLYMKSKVFIYIEYDNVKFAILNDTQKNKILTFVYHKNDEGGWYYLGQLNIFGYYPKQLRKIFYNVQKRITNDITYRQSFIDRTITISKARTQAYRWFKYVQGLKGS